MDRKEIESKDKELLKGIREIVRRNEEKSPKKRSLFQSMKFWLPVLVVVLVIAVTMTFNKPSTPDKSNEAIQASSEGDDAKPSVGDEESVDLKIAYDSENREMVEDSVREKESGGTDEEASSEKEPPVQEASEMPSESGEKASASAKEIEPVVKETIPSTKALVPSEPIQTGGVEEKATAAVRSEPAKTSGSGGGGRIDIAKLVSCAGVQDRQYVSPQSVFSMKKNSKPVVWMTVLTDNPPFTLTHVYYHNEKKYCEVPLKVEYPRMRTWSRLTLQYPYQAGNYRVEVTTDAGEVLGEIEYIVVP